MGGWLRKQFIKTCQDNCPSWRALVVAVKSPVGGNSGAGARKIADNYEGGLQPRETAPIACQKLLPSDDWPLSRNN